MDNKEIVPPEKCFVDKEYDLIKKCCESEYQQRIRLTDVKKRLEEVRQNAYVGMYHPYKRDDHYLSNTPHNSMVYWLNKPRGMLEDPEERL